MEITYQYYNEIVLVFKDYEIDFDNGIIVIQVPDDKKPFNNVCEKIKNQLTRVAESLENRDKEIIIRVKRAAESEEIILEKMDAGGF